MASGAAPEYVDRKVSALAEIFQSLEREIIDTVFCQCQFDFAKASNVLAEMSGHRNNSQEIANASYHGNQIKQSKNVTPYDSIIGFIKQGYKIIVLMRGLPGSGKTTLAQDILRSGLGLVNKDEFIFSTDDYFYKSGRYIYNANELEEAHNWNHRRCFSNMKKGVSPIIIDNTNLQSWEMKVYCVMAVQFGYIVEMAVASTSWALNPKILATKNNHGVDKQKIKDMLDRFSQYVTVKDLFKEFKLEYTVKLPQFRQYPPIPKPEQPNVATDSSVIWRAPQREYSSPQNNKPQLPIEYVHKFEMKQDRSSPKKQVTNADEILTVDNGNKSTGPNPDDLISFINEHKLSPIKEQPIKSTDTEVLTRQLQENTQLMAQMMAFLSQQATAKAQDSNSDEKITSSTTTETKMEVDQAVTNETQKIVQNETDRADDKTINLPLDGMDVLEKENKILWEMLNRTQTPNLEEDRSSMVSRNSLSNRTQTPKLEEVRSSMGSRNSLSNRTQTPKLEEVRSSMGSCNSLSKTRIEKTPKAVQTGSSDREKLQFDRLNMFFSQSEELNSFEFVENIMSSSTEQIAEAPVKNEKNPVPKFDSKAWGLSDNALKNEKTPVPKFDSKAWGLSDNALKNEKTPVPKFDSKAWGLSDNALVSWESPTSPYEIPVDVKPSLVETHDQSTNTTADDFKLARHTSENDNSVTKLTGRETPICVPKKLNNVSPRKKITLDKGCMTDDEELLLQLNCEESEQVKKMKEIFPNIPLEDLLDVYEKCDKDFHWTVDLISNSPAYLLSTNNTENLKRKNQSKNSEPPQKNKSGSFALNDWNLNSRPKVVNTQAADEEITKKKQEEEEAKQLKKQEEVLELKKQMEKAVTIGKEHYSDHVWQLKNAKTGAVPRQKDVSEPEKKVDSPELMTVDDDTVYISDSNSDSDSENDEVEEDLVELNLGSGLVQQLENMFGQLIQGENFKPVVQMPESLARQLHALYLESICRQIENQSEYISSQLKEDEQYAMKLQESERGSASGNNLNEIMDEALALSIYQKDVDQWKNITPDTLALKLTRQKLHAAFPQIEPKVLDEVLVAHDNNYMHTIEAIMNSMGTPPMQTSNTENPMEPPISDSTLNEMRKQDHFVNKVTDETDGVVKSAASYRDQANMHMQKRRELLQLAQEQFQRRSYHVAMYYRHLAQVELKKAEVANQHATHSFIEENAEKLQKGDTLDLHFLYVRDAVVTLDIFIDYQISNLKRVNKPHDYYYVITGRGNRSENGISKLKPAVIKRLKKRKVSFTSINPGMLRIKVQKNLPMSTDVEKPQARNGRMKV